MSFKLKGIPAFQANVQELVKKFPIGARRGLYLGLEFVMTDAKQNYVPVRFGVLRASGFVIIDDVRLKGTIGFGGPAGTGNMGETNAEDVAYAIVQHERLDFHHDVGEAKYLERPLFADVDMIGEMVVKGIQEETGIS